MDQQKQEDDEHPVEDAFVVALLDPGVVLSEVKKRVPRSQAAPLEPLLDLQLAPARRQVLLLLPGPHFSNT